MEYEIAWDSGPEDVMVTTAGLASVDDLDAMTHAVLEDSRFREGMAVLVDHTATSWAHLRPDEVRRRADLLAVDAERIGRQRIAFVVAADVDFGVSRMLQTYVGERLEIDFQIFRLRDEARAWLARVEPDL